MSFSVCGKLKHSGVNCPGYHKEWGEIKIKLTVKRKQPVHREKYLSVTIEGIDHSYEQ